MSEIIELLKQKDIDYNRTQERLAETYFPSVNETTATSSSSTSRKKNKTLLAIAGFSIAILSLSAVLFYIFYTHTISIDVSINRKVRSPYKNLLNVRSVGLLTKSVAVDLKEPIDLSSKYLLISVFSKEAGGRLKVILRDKNYRSYTSNMLDIKKKRQNFIISAKNSKKSIDIRKIKHIRLEPEDNLTEKDPAMYIEKITLINN